MHRIDASYLVKAQLFSLAEFLGGEILAMKHIITTVAEQQCQQRDQSEQYSLSFHINIYLSFKQSCGDPVRQLDKRDKRGPGLRGVKALLMLRALRGQIPGCHMPADGHHLVRLELQAP